MKVPFLYLYCIGSDICIADPIRSRDIYLTFIHLIFIFDIYSDSHIDCGVFVCVV